MKQDRLSNSRCIARVMHGVDSEDGAGVKLKRSIGRSPQHRFDPFLMLDAFSSMNPDDYIAGFPAHPHRGFETVTYMLDGHMIHKDHMGNEGELKAGGVQWMTAGRGVIHEERPVAVEGLMRGFQLWINLPSSEKMKPAAYQNITAQEIPQVTLSCGAVIKVIAGELDLEGIQHRGPIHAACTQAIYLDIAIPPSSEVFLPIPTRHQSCIHLFEGQASVLGDDLLLNGVSCLSNGEGVVISTKAQSARMLLLAGAPIGEPIVQYGPFVMNTMSEVEQAITDYRNNCLVE